MTFNPSRGLFQWQSVLGIGCRRKVGCSLEERTRREVVDVRCRAAAGRVKGVRAAPGAPSPTERRGVGGWLRLAVTGARRSQ